MTEPGPSSSNRLKRQHSIEDHDSFNYGSKKPKQEVSLYTEYETLELGLLSPRSPGAQSLASPRSVAETPEVQARRDAHLRIAIQHQAELQNQIQSPKFPATVWRDGMIIGFSAETDRQIPSVLKAKYPPLAPSLTRSVSSSSLASSFMLPPEPPRFAPNSSHEHLGVTKTSIDFSLPPPPAVDNATTSQYEYLPMTCSVNNIFFFTRGNRLHYKNLHTTEDIVQLFKLKDKYGDIQVVQCGGFEQSNTLAVSTSKGYIHIWDVASKRATMSWHTRDVGAMQWNGPVLTVGEVKGTIRFFDIRISPATKLKGEARKLIRHQTRITHLAWNENKKYLATGDDSGTVYCWDDRQKSPLDVGEFVQRRKKIQHDAAVTALSWCPWQRKYLGTGDAKGTIRLWSIDPEESRPNVVGPNHTIRTGSRVSGLHFSSLCKEMISVHGKEAETLPWDNNPLIHRFPTQTANSVVAHTFPNSRHVKTLSVSDKPLAGSVMVGNGMKVIVAVPEEGKLKLCDVWGKPPPIKRQPSLVDKAMSSIR
ncbi:hypothetical protein E1B28_013692 [Marasmius oreades]|uniref:WD40 repeat-like protein n=1 Tax=Marasmius oreades TaxID=181124 RepID=A0A9P7UP97_9AGAR|nr:uncharacterized protein E1B28_013692 [Marasmius oreades]KAG7087751.1 hypothetical protein E1B28_013692 [Marasmius oreades]